MSMTIKLDSPNQQDFSKIAGVGVDVVQVSRFASKLDDRKFLERLFSEGEIKDCQGAQSVSQFAARWAAKEALAKALGCGLGKELGWREIEVIKTRAGKPALRLSEEAKKRHNHPVFHLSLSHDGDYAVAFVIMVRNS